VLSLTNASACSAYDCEFVALAKQLNVKLITPDKKILSEFPDHAFSISDYLKT
jgi:predicted nucleic acid-binding protein